MSSAQEDKDQHRSTMAMLNYLELIAVLENRRRVGEITRENLRAILVDFVAGIGGSERLSLLLPYYGLVIDAYSDLKFFISKNRVLIDRQRRAAVGTIFATVDERIAQQSS